MVGLAFQVNLDEVPVSRLLAFRDRYADERAAFQQQIKAMVSNLAAEDISDPDALRDHLQAQSDKVLKPQLDDLRRRLGDSRIDTVTGLANVELELPTSLALVGAAMLQSGRPVLAAGAVALGVWRVWRVWQDRTRARTTAIRESPASAYLYHLETDLQPDELAGRIQRMSRRFVPRP